MKDKIGVGSVCIIVQDGNTYEDLVGRECTVVGMPRLRKSLDRNKNVYESVAYEVTIQDFGCALFNAEPAQLRLKRFPGQVEEWAASKVKELCKPNTKLVEEEV